MVEKLPFADRNLKAAYYAFYSTRKPSDTFKAIPLLIPLDFKEVSLQISALLILIMSTDAHTKEQLLEQFCLVTQNVISGSRGIKIRLIKKKFPSKAQRRTAFPNLLSGWVQLSRKGTVWLSMLKPVHP